VAGDGSTMGELVTMKENMREYRRSRKGDTTYKAHSSLPRRRNPEFFIRRSTQIFSLSGFRPPE
jgi:hypothetical protein